MKKNQMPLKIFMILVCGLGFQIGISQAAKADSCAARTLYPEAGSETWLEPLNEVTAEKITHVGSEVFIELPKVKVQLLDRTGRILSEQWGFFADENLTDLCAQFKAPSTAPYSKPRVVDANIHETGFDFFQYSAFLDAHGDVALKMRSGFWNALDELHCLDKH
jgi:hypothetical protein